MVYNDNNQKYDLGCAFADLTGNVIFWNCNGTITIYNRSPLGIIGKFIRMHAIIQCSQPGGMGGLMMR